MIIETISDEKLNKMTNEPPKIEETSNYCLNIVVDIQPIRIIQQEFSEEEMQTLPEKIGMFSFLSDSEEDIYTRDDGVPLEWKGEILS